MIENMQVSYNNGDESWTGRIDMTFWSVEAAAETFEAIRLGEARGWTKDVEYRDREVEVQRPFLVFNTDTEQLVKTAVMAVWQLTEGKITTIKLHRHLTMAGLKESKDQVEAWIAELEAANTVAEG